MAFNTVIPFSRTQGGHQGHRKAATAPSFWGRSITTTAALPGQVGLQRRSMGLLTKDMGLRSGCTYIYIIYNVSVEYICIDIL